MKKYDLIFKNIIYNFVLRLRAYLLNKVGKFRPDWGPKCVGWPRVQLLEGMVLLEQKPFKKPKM